MSYSNYNSPFFKPTPVVQNLLIANVLVFVAQFMFGGNAGSNTVTDFFALHHYKSDVFKPHQIITHMFMHGGLGHLFFNMFSLYMFGTMIENVWGAKRFITFYLVCGIGAGLAQLGSYAYTYWAADHQLLDYQNLMAYQELLKMNFTVGASGAIMGVMVAFGYLFPNTEMMIIPIPFPIKAKWLVLGYIAIDLFGGLSNKSGGGIAHFAHLGGALTGFLMVFFQNKKNKKTFY
jgi:membrane associated rhomboid family serine protease